VDENVQPANSLMGVKPKPAPAERGLGEPSLPEADDGPPTLNLQSASGAAVSGAPRPI